MITPVAIPKLTLTMEGGTIIKWLKQEGDTILKDEILFELETDKAVVEVPAPGSGILKRILLREGQATVGKTVAFIGDPADDVPEVGALSGPQSRVSAPVAGQSVSTSQSNQSGIIRATPAARRRARELTLNIDQIQGTGPEGRITQEDVERVEAQQRPKASSGAPAVRRMIAERMTNSWRTVPHIHVGGELRAACIRPALEKARRALGTEVTVTDILLYAVASLLPRFPALNSIWQDERPEPRQPVHLAFAVQTERGVVAPIIHDADHQRLREISVERRRLTEAARACRLKSNEVEGGTFTLTNLGMYPVDFFAPIINYPQCAILATGRLREAVEITDGRVSAVQRLWVNLAVDHRVADGALAGEFLQELEKAFDSLDLQL